MVLRRAAKPCVVTSAAITRAIFAPPTAAGWGRSVLRASLTRPPPFGLRLPRPPGFLLGQPPVDEPEDRLPREEEVGALRVAQITPLGARAGLGLLRGDRHVVGALVPLAHEPRLAPLRLRRRGEAHGVGVGLAKEARVALPVVEQAAP